MRTRKSVESKLGSLDGALKRIQYYIKANEGNNALNTVDEARVYMEDIQTLINREDYN
tara:strand:+ start:3044 stop:3217 length:174 start_codon:yes stop_codon:yes gene_type:complete